MTTIYMTNTLTRKKDEFKPIDASNVRMYVCGPTVYDRAHLGNARTAVVFDSWFRLLRQVYGAEHVTYASNITDVDDKILNKHKETGRSIREITEQTYQWYVDDMKKLNVLDPTFRPRATEFINEMIDLVKLLVDNGHAYEVEGQVLFDVDSMPNYGSLSGRSLKEMLAGARIEVADYKKNPADFILWKPSDADQPGWDSPWGYGRPGWHLECSAMSSKHLGNSFDIHGGGSDLIFPHHENECAQSMCAHPHDNFANYWLHGGMLMVDGVKMSKSLNNFYTVDDVFNKYPPEALRLLFLTTHYHQPFNFTFEGLQLAKNTLDKFYNAIRNLNCHCEECNDAAIAAFQTCHCERSAAILAFHTCHCEECNDAAISANYTPDSRVIDALADDLNTPLALSYLHEAVNNLNKATTDEEKANYSGILLASAHLLGLLEQSPEAWFKGATDGFDESAIEAQIAARAEAKKNKNFALADKIRDELKEQGIILEDSATGTTWKKN